MAAGSETLHLTLQMALPSYTTPQNHDTYNRFERVWLTAHKQAEIARFLRLISEAAQYCLQKFEAHQETLWWTPLQADEFGDPLLSEEGGFAGRKRISGELRVVIKLREVAPLKDPDLPSVVKDGIHHKVADLLRSYAQRMLDPQLRDKTTYPQIRGEFPAIWQNGFQFLEHRETGKLFLYLPFFARGRHQEDLRSNFDPSVGPSLRKFGEDEIQKLARAKGGLLLPLELDKWGEATFIRGPDNPPRWKATERPYDRRWMEELKRNKDFAPKRVELFVRGNRVFVNVACEVACKAPVETATFMGVAFGIHDLLDIVVIDMKGNILHHRKVSTAEYEHTIFAELSRLRQERGGKFHQRLETFHYTETVKILQEAVRFKAVIATETIGNIPKGRYSPLMNLRLSFWPFGKLTEIISYKAMLEGLSKPYKVYSATVRGLCSSCGASNRNGEQHISLEGALYYCGKCNTKGNSGFNAALNLARRAQELSAKGVVAR